MHVGFTGSRVGMSEIQKSILSKLLDELKPEKIHLGDCIGSDTEAYHIAKDRGMYTIGHVPENTRFASNLTYDERRQPSDYLTRNRQIVDQSTILIATPDRDEEIRSGTWYTIRYAEKMRKKIYIIKKNGIIILIN